MTLRQISPPPPTKYGVADPELCERLIVSPDYAMQEKVDGIRLTVLIDESGINGYNKRGEPVGVSPWLHRELSLLPETPWAFDGEFTGNQYHIFNLLEAPKREIAEKPFTERMALLNVLVTTLMGDADSPESIRVVDTWLEPKEKLKGLLKLSVTGSEGAVFRPQIESANFQGQVYKYKFRNTVDAVVMNNTAGVSSVEIGLYHNNELTSVGKCTVHSEMRPGTVIEVSYRMVSANGRLVEPVLVGVRDDKLSYQCTWDQLVIGKHLQDSELIDSQTARISAALGLSPEELHKFTTSL